MNHKGQSVYTRSMDKIVADLEQGVRTLMKLWNAGNKAGRIMMPLRSNGIPYSGINILMLWAKSIEKGFASPTWMMFRQASGLDAHVRKGERGSLVVYCRWHGLEGFDFSRFRGAERGYHFRKFRWSSEKGRVPHPWFAKGGHPPCFCDSRETLPSCFCQRSPAEENHEGFSGPPVGASCGGK